MAKRKLQRFGKLTGFENVFQPPTAIALDDKFPLKGKWNTSYFKNDNPIILELGCGKGEYTVGLAAEYPEKNFIGIDIKGARIWRGAKTALDNRMKNVAFLRARIDLVTAFFGKDEVSEIWITFPDPQPNKKKKRLTSSKFLNSYKKFLIDDGIIHLKTDNEPLFIYTRELILQNNLPLLANIQTIEQSNLNIRTFYEERFLELGVPIKYLKFQLGAKEKIEEPVIDLESVKPFKV
ncbi:MAG: tRNA (guanosine(46)-N7)-methyltransferase TrmB [Bacteroidia bacterium]|nr:tRNA (guanosine(46)-N7)-methyltransferase TrmB [Bacteroidia bacterium]